MPETTLKRRLEILRSQLDNERQSFKSHWKDLCEYILPRRGRFFVSDSNKGDRRNHKIIDSTATIAVRTLSAGMMGGITSPARPWFRLTTSEPGLAEVAAVKDWLHAVTKRMQTVFLRSNLYNALPLVYKDIGTFATSALFVVEDEESVVRFYTFPIGSYMIGNDRKLRVRIFFREWRMTVRQIVEEFGKLDKEGNVEGDNISDHVKTLWKNNQTEEWVEVCHVVLPNPYFDPGLSKSEFKRFASITYEKGTSSVSKTTHATDDKQFLRRSGFDMFPVLAPRWEVTGEDVYGTSCPGMDGLGDIRQLQTGERRGGQAIEKMVKPSLVGPTSLKTVRTSLVPGDITYSDEREGTKGLRPIHEVDPKIQELEGKQEQVRRRIKRAFFEDLFLMLATSDRREITAREIEERHEEKLLALGPVLEQLNQDLLDPLIDLTFDIMARQGLLPEPPEELQGVDLKVEYISIMAQAQKLVGIASLERFAGFAANIAAQTGDPTKVDKVNWDQMLDEHGDATSVPPGVVRSDEEVDEIRAGRAQQQQAQAQAEAIQGMAGAAKDLGSADLEKDTALKRLIEQSEAGQAVPGV